MLRPRRVVAAAGKNLARKVASKLRNKKTSDKRNRKLGAQRDSNSRGSDSKLNRRARMNAKVSGSKPYSSAPNSAGSAKPNAHRNKPSQISARNNTGSVKPNAQRNKPSQIS